MRGAGAGASACSAGGCGRDAEHARAGFPMGEQIAHRAEPEQEGDAGNDQPARSQERRRGGAPSGVDRIVIAVHLLGLTACLAQLGGKLQQGLVARRRRDGDRLPALAGGARGLRR